MATTMRRTAALLFAAVTCPVSVLSFTSGFIDNNSPPYNLCTKDAYYADFIEVYGSDPTKWSKDMVVKLITDTHRNVLDNVAPVQNADDIILALKNLWNFTGQENRITLLYRDEAFPANLANTQLGWEREDIWPKGRGWDVPKDLTPFTDIYGKAPADATVLRRKASLFFGSCGTVQNIKDCVTPASIEAGVTTQQDGKIFKPPVYHLGDVARALFYMEVRYGATLNLTLTDCPPFTYAEFGYKSELLAWHVADPPDSLEMGRNDVGCERWQGNRNPFVDFPDLIQLFHPEGPDTLVPNSYKYSQCIEPTNAPTATPNTCRDLEIGDIPIFLVNSLDPDQIILFPLVDLDPSIGALYVTDNAWDGNAFLKTEGVLEFEIPETGIKAGDIFMYGGTDNEYADNWKQLPNEGNNFDLNTAQGDSIFVYCLDGDNLPVIINGWSNAGPWLNPGLKAEQYGVAFSSLPAVLDNGGSVFLTHYDNCVYVGPLEGVEKKQLAAFMIDPTLFDCVDTPRIQLNMGSAATRSTSMTTLVATASLGMSAMLLLW